MNRIRRTPDTTSQSLANGNCYSVDAISAIVLDFLVHRSIDDSANELYNLCIFLSRAIDHAIANNEVPTRASELPILLKQLCRFVNPMLQAATMVLMYSVKYACKKRWFSDKDAHEIRILAAELKKIFSSSPNPDTNTARSYLPTISKIMSRFCSMMKMGHILAFLVVKPGNDAYVIDFVVKNFENSSRGEKIYLFVAKTDDIETSKCFVTPPNVNFLLNGKEVEGRNMVSMDIGPQIPTDVTHMLQFGPNLLQVVGRFFGNYVIAIAYMAINGGQSSADVASSSARFPRSRVDGLLHQYRHSLSPAQANADLARSSSHFPRSSNNNVLVRQFPAWANADMARPSAHFPRINNFGGPSRAVSRPGGAGESQSQHGWQPTGQMRGSLTGSAYSAALAQIYNLAGPPHQPARSLSGTVEPPPGFPPKP